MAYDAADAPLTLRAEDRAAPDPQEAGIEMMALARTVSEDMDSLHRLLASWDADPMAIRRRAQSRALELAETASRLHDACERVQRGKRMAGVYSHDYRDGGVD